MLLSHADTDLFTLAGAKELFPHGLEASAYSLNALRSEDQMEYCSPVNLGVLAS